MGKKSKTITEKIDLTNAGRVTIAYYSDKKITNANIPAWILNELIDKWIKEQTSDPSIRSIQLPANFFIATKHSS